MHPCIIKRWHTNQYHGVPSIDIVKNEWQYDGHLEMLVWPRLPKNIRTIIMSFIIETRYKIGFFSTKFFSFFSENIWKSQISKFSNFVELTQLFFDIWPPKKTHCYMKTVSERHARGGVRPRGVGLPVPVFSQ